MDHQNEEEWRPVPGWPGVMASSLGRVHQTRRLGCKQSKQTYGSISTNRYKSGLTYQRRIVSWACGTFLVSRLVCMAWHGEAPFASAMVLHGDDNSLNNRPENLRWGTQTENMAAPGYRARQREVWARRKEDAAQQAA